jgi:hypothetical protein
MVQHERVEMRQHWLIERNGHEHRAAHHKQVLEPHKSCNVGHVLYPRAGNLNQPDSCLVHIVIELLLHIRRCCIGIDEAQKHGPFAEMFLQLRLRYHSKALYNNTRIDY